LAGSVLASVGGLSCPFYVLAVALGLALVALLAVPQPRAEPDSSARRRAADALDRAALVRRRSLPLASRPVVALLLLAVGAQLANGLYDALWSRLLTDRGAGTLLIGLSLTLYGIPFILAAPFGGRVAGRRGPLMVSGAGLLVAAGFLASYGFVTVPVVILVLGVMEAFAQALAVPGGLAAVANVFPDHQAATGQGWFAAAGTAAAGTAAMIGAPIYAAFGPGAVFGGGAVISAAFVIGAMVVGRGRMGGRPRRA
jgi:predicted MFS family arabinose efflux permease